MSRIHRRHFLAAGAAALGSSAIGARAFAQAPGHEHHGGLYESLQ
jgi:hypothetical protein